MNAKSDVILEDYPSRQLLDMIANRWTPIVLYCLGQGKRRYSDLQRQLPGVSKKMLTQTLRALECDGMLTRTVLPRAPLHVDYELTQLGYIFLEPVALLCQWATGHQADLNCALKNRCKAKPALKPLRKPS